MRVVECVCFIAPEWNRQLKFKPIMDFVAC